MIILCPYCQQEYDIEDSWIGKTVQCTDCNEEFTISLEDRKFCCDSKSERRIEIQEENIADKTSKKNSFFSGCFFQSFVMLLIIGGVR